MATKTSKATTKNSKSKSTKKENPMTPSENILNIFNSFIEAGGLPKVTEFKKHLDQLINAEIKSLCSSRGKSAGGTGWRSELKARFGGRGAKWVSVSLEEIAPTLETYGDDVVEYRNWIDKAGYAWIRFSGPRVSNGVNCAAFEVRTGGSTIDHPKQLHYIDVNELDDKIKSLSGTPHAMRLEQRTTAPVATEKDEVNVSDETPSDEIETEVVEVVEKELNAAPTSDDPEEWEAFLAAEGLGIDNEEDDDLYSF